MHGKGGERARTDLEEIQVAFREVDPGDAETLNGLIGSSAKVRFRFGKNGRLYAKLGIPPRVVP